MATPAADVDLATLVKSIADAHWASVPARAAPSARRMVLAAMVGDLAMLLASYVAAVVNFDAIRLAPSHLATWCAALVAVWIPFAVQQGAYDRSILVQRIRSPYLIAKATIVAGAVFHLLPLVGSPVHSRIAAVSIVASMTGALVLWRLVLAHIIPVRIATTDLIVVGAGWAGRTLAEGLAQNPRSGLRIVAFADDNPDLVGTWLHGAMIYPVKNLPWLIGRADKPVRVVMAITRAASSKVYDQLTSIAQRGVDVQPMSVVYEQVTGRVPVQHLEDSWWAVLPVTSTDLLHAGAKRVVDVVASLFGLAGLALVLPFVAPFLVRETGGSLFFSQLRIGRNGRPIKIYKLRTLPVIDHSHASIWERKRSNQPRRLGALLRATGIDELPQFFNVLKGEMSLVGPRPYVPQEVADLQKRIPLYRSRALVRPGITGWAQVNSGYGLSLGEELEKLQYDLYYVARQSTYLDLVIILRTLGLVLRRRRTVNTGT